jgi:hypothetical protein
MNWHPPHVVSCVCVLLLAELLGMPRANATDQAPEQLHGRIDRLIETAEVSSPVAVAGDAEFLRRVSLDLTGMPPTLEDLRQFLVDSSADKRARVIERLLDSPLFSRHWATTLDVMLMERRPAVQVNADEWHTYISSAARENRPINQIIRELLSADAVDPKRRATARFYLDRAGEPNAITRDVGRIFLGRDLQCAQCHNHPLVKDYQQSDYYGLLAFSSPGYAFTKTEGTKETIFFPEKAPADLAFDSVFVKGDSHMTGPRLPGGTEIPEPVFPPGEEYLVKPADQAFPVPKYSRRVRLASTITDGTNRAFNENIANRLWAMMMGRGLVHPVDLHHPSNPPSHPELMRLLGTEIAAEQFNAKAFLRQLALTRTYQRTIDLPAALFQAAPAVASKLSALKAQSDLLEQTAEKARQEYSSSVKAWHKVEGLLIPISAEHDKALAAYVQASKKEAEARQAVASASAQLVSKRAIAKSLAEAAAHAQQAAASLPLEKDLATAAQKFVSRSASAAAELPALEKGSAGLVLALTKSVEAVIQAKQAVELARGKMKPVRDSVRQAEIAMLEKRARMVDTRSIVEHHLKRVELLEAHVARESLCEQLASVARSIETRRGALATAQKRLEQASAELGRAQDASAKANLALAAAEKDRLECQAAVDRQNQIQNAVETAKNATRAAVGQLPTDQPLSEVERILVAKSRELQSVGPALNARLAEVASGFQKRSQVKNAADQELKVSTGKKTIAETAIKDAQAGLTAEEARLQSLRTDLAAADEQLATRLADRFSLAQLKPLTPEQMCWSIARVTGVYDRNRRIAEAELNKAKPLKAGDAGDLERERARAVEIEQRTFDKLKTNVSSFIQIYGAGAGQPQTDFFATADQALFAANGTTLNGWIAPSDGNLAQQMIQESNPAKAADNLYMTVLSRAPGADELAEVTRLLSVPAKEKPAAVQELVWGLITSAEFRFNH